MNQVPLGSLYGKKSEILDSVSFLTLITKLQSYKGSWIPPSGEKGQVVHINTGCQRWKCILHSFRKLVSIYSSLSAEIPYWWHITTQIWVVSASDWLLLIGHATWKICFNQSEALCRFGKWHVINVEFLHLTSSNVISWGNQEWCHKMSVFYSG